MRKPDGKEVKQAAIKVSDTAVKNMLAYLDTRSGERKDVETHIANTDLTIEALQKEIVRYTERKNTLLEQLAKMPEGEMTADDMRAVLERVASMPWVDTVAVQGEYMTVRTRKGQLKTPFYSGIAYTSDGRRQEFMLDEVTYAEMPQYFIRISLAGIANKDMWYDKNVRAVAIRFADEDQFKDFIAETGLYHHLNAHWGCNGDAFEWDDLCLGGYADGFRAEANKGIPELLSAVSLYLQSSGWASAYRHRLQWASTLGFAPINEVIFKKVADRDALEEIRTQYQQDVRNVATKLGISVSMFFNGSEGRSDDAGDYGYDDESF